jgi:hypothetical protein
MVLFLCAALFVQAQDFALDNLPILHNFQSRRITSTDPTGNNDDWRQLEPGQTLVFADIAAAAQMNAYAYVGSTGEVATIAAVKEFPTILLC